MNYTITSKKNVKKREPKHEVAHIVRTSFIRNTFYKGDTTNWSWDFLTKRNFLDDATRIYYLQSFRRKCDAVLKIKKTLTKI